VNGSGTPPVRSSRNLAYLLSFGQSTAPLIRLSALSHPAESAIYSSPGNFYLRQTEYWVNSKTPVHSAMATSQSPVQVVRFEGFEANLRSRELRRDGERVRLPDQSFEVLVMLIEKSGELVSREEVRQRLWSSDTFVDFDHGLNNAVKRLRDALQDSAETPRFIETLPRRGYRFIGTIDSPSRHPQDISETVPEIRLRRPIVLVFALAAALVLLLSLVGSYFFKKPPASVAPKPFPIMLAVLPFQNLSGDPSQEYFTDGLTEEMISQMGELNGDQLGVIARTSSMMYKNTTKDIGQIGRELGVDYVLESSVRREGDHVRITVQLIRVNNQVHVWANSYDREVKHSIEVQEEVARAIAEQIQVKLANTVPGNNVTASSPLNPEANDAYLRGRYFFNQFTEEGFRRAIEYFNQAIAVDPKFAAAYSGLSDSYNFLVITNVIPPKMGFPKAEAAALRAVELDGSLSEAHTSLGLLKMNTWHWNDCQTELKVAIELNPSNSTAHRWYAACLVSVGKVEQAVKEIREAHRVDPVSMPNNAEIVRDLYYARNFQQAVLEAHNIEQFDPTFPRTHFWLGRVYAQMGKHPEAIAEAEKVGPPDSNQTLTETAYAEALAGKTTAARALLAKLEARSKTGFVPAYDLAVINLALEDKEAAVGWLQKAYEEGDWAFIVFLAEPRLDPLRSDPRFQAILKKLDLPRAQ
jgi:TolB-like protein/DNA-binding winged helix-turn-helix (wHTH) protein/Flp pilus assembly protein TadD